LAAAAALDDAAVDPAAKAAVAESPEDPPVQPRKIKKS